MGRFGSMECVTCGEYFDKRRSNQKYCCRECYRKTDNCKKKRELQGNRDLMKKFLKVFPNLKKY